MNEPLTEEYVNQAIADARRYQGQWTGTSGSLAAHIMRIARERERLLTTMEKLESENATMRQAVADRLGAGDKAVQPADLELAWASHKKRHQATTAAACSRPCQTTRVYAALDDQLHPVSSPDVSPAEELCHMTADVIRDRRPRYGGPREHFKRTIGMVNAAFADVLKRPLTEADWAIIMTLDKVARYRGPASTVDGPIDIAGYAACLYEVSRPE